MRKRTRKHRGTAGKMVGGFLAFFCLILLTAGMFWAIQGICFLSEGSEGKAARAGSRGSQKRSTVGLLLNRCRICTKKRCCC